MADRSSLPPTNPSSVIATNALPLLPPNPSPLVPATNPSSTTNSSSLSGTNPQSLLPAPLHACIYRPPLAGPAASSSGTLAAAGTLVAIAEQFSPRYERHHDDLVSIDVSGLDRLLGPPRVIGEELRREAAARGIRAHIAIARTRTAAMVVALAHPGLTVVPRGEEAATLASLPIALLEKIIGSASSADSASSALSAFKRWGLKTLGEVAALPAADLVARLGRRALEWQALARGDDIRPLVPTQAEERFESSIDLEWPIEELEPLSFVLTRLLEPLSTRLERRDRGAAVLHVLLQLVTRVPVTAFTPQDRPGGGPGSAGWERVLYARRLELPSPMRAVRTLRTLALLDLESHPPDAAIDRVTIVIDPTPGRVLQHTLFTRAHPTPEQLSTLLARLGALMGQDRFGAPATVDTYRPGAFVMTAYATEHRDTVERKAREAGKENSGEQPSALSHQPLTCALRRCRQPVPARVAVAGGRPVRVTTDRRGFTGGAVVRAAGPWRTSGEWWNRSGGSRGSGGSGGSSGLGGSGGLVGPGEAGGETSVSSAPFVSSVPAPHQLHQARWNRDEWDVSLSDGAMYRIFQDRETEGWFIDAFVD
jgi:protein ImuB